MTKLKKTETTTKVVELKPQETFTEEQLAKGKDLVTQHLDKELDFINGNKDLIKATIAENTQLAEFITQALTKNVHYGRMPGTTTPALFQSGADVIERAYGLTVKYTRIDKTVSPAEGYIDYEYKAELYYKGKLLKEGMASANSLESKFKGHFMEFDNKTKTWSQIPNKSVFDIKNTIDQMAQKRAEVRVVRKALGITSAFTQDTENIGTPATKDEQMEVYGELYELKHLAPQTFTFTYKDKKKAPVEKETTDKSKKDWLKENVLKPILKENNFPKNLKNWSLEQVTTIIKQIKEKGVHYEQEQKH